MPERDVVMELLAAQICSPSSKLVIRSWFADTTLGHELGHMSSDGRYRALCSRCAGRPGSKDCSPTLSQGSSDLLAMPTPRQHQAVAFAHDPIKNPKKQPDTDIKRQEDPGNPGIFLSQLT